MAITWLSHDGHMVITFATTIHRKDHGQIRAWDQIFEIFTENMIMVTAELEFFSGELFPSDC